MYILIKLQVITTHNCGKYMRKNVIEGAHADFRSDSACAHMNALPCVNNFCFCVCFPHAECVFDRVECRRVGRQELEFVSS